ncbi:MAG: tetratricopeptide repeat protein [Caldilineaceae bacterium]|nr:tetratricopeptide repeat protein [Caldilineaceae bacterium]
MYLDRTYRPRRKRKGLSRFWPLILLAIIAIVLYEQQPRWLVGASFQPTPVPTRSAVAFLSDAEIALITGNIGSAIEAFEQMVRLEPQNPRPLIELSRLYLTLRDFDQSERMARRAVEVAPESADALAALGRILDWRGDLEGALNYALDALEIENDNATTLAILGEIYTDVGNWPVAEDYLQQALELDGRNVLALRNLAYYHENLGEYEAALEAFNRAIEIAPHRFDLYIEKGRQYRIGLLDYELANAAFRQAVEAYESAVTLDALGDGLYNSGDHLQAVRVLRQAVELDPEYGPAQVHLGMALYARRNYEDAAPHLEKGLNLVGDSARIEQIYTLGLAHIYKNPTECDKAQFWLRKALEIDPESGPSLEGLALCTTS